MRGKDSSTLKAKVMNGVDIVSSVINDPNGIGFTSPLNLLGLLGKRVRLLAIDDALPTPETIFDSAYPIRRTLSLITAHKKNSATQAFIDYCLAVDKGQAIIKKLGLVPAVLR